MRDKKVCAVVSPGVDSLRGKFAEASRELKQVASGASSAPDSVSDMKLF